MGFLEYLPSWWTTLAVTAIIVGTWLLFVIAASLAKSKWGINLSEVSCPSCGEPQPRIRQPTSRRQRLWGGSTCPKCACEMDKWGKRITQ